MDSARRKNLLCSDSAQPKVDAKRLAVVGRDYGGLYATLMAGVDPRASTYVLIAVTPSLNDWAFFAQQPKDRLEYLRRGSALDLPTYLRQVNGASFLFQFGKSDFYVSGAGAAVYFRSANQRKERKVYDADHAMNKPEIRADRTAWLVKELKLR